MRLPDIGGPLRRADRARLEWSDALVNTAAGLRKVALFGFLESTFLPAPLEAITVPLMLHRPARAYWIAFALWIGLMAGAISFYLLGRAVFDPVVGPVLEALDLRGDFDQLAEELTGRNLFWAIFVIAIAPAPLQLATLGAGFIDGDPTVFVTAIGLSRGLRYFGAAWLCRMLGERLARLRGGTVIQLAGVAAVLALAWLVYRMIA